MHKFWTTVKHVFHDVDTTEARKSVAGDFKKASYLIFTLFVMALPGSHHSLVMGLAKVLKVEEASIAVSSWTAAGLVLLSLLFRVAAFILECDFSHYTKEEETHAPSAKKHASESSEDEEESTEDEE